jgi:phospholipase C
VRAGAPATYDHVIWILFENKRYGSVIGNASAPYMSGVASQCASVANWADAGSEYPSLPSYLALTSGSNQQVTDDSGPGGLPAITADNIFRQVRARGLSERSYQEDMPGNCATSSSGDYAVRHNPAAYYRGADDRSACLADDVPMGTTSGGAFLDDLQNGTLPSFAVVTPNLCNDMHDCSVATGDRWLGQWLPRILDSSAYREGRTAVFVAWDEDTPIPNIEIAPSVTPGTVLQGSYSHYSLLRATEEMLGISEYLGDAATSPSLRGPLGL